MRPPEFQPDLRLCKTAVVFTGVCLCVSTRNETEKNIDQKLVQLAMTLCHGEL